MHFCSKKVNFWPICDFLGFLAKFQKLRNESLSEKAASKYMFLDDFGNLEDFCQKIFLLGLPFNCLQKWLKKKQKQKQKQKQTNKQTNKKHFLVVYQKCNISFNKKSDNLNRLLVKFPF